MLPSPLPLHDVVSYCLHSVIDVCGALANGYLLLAVLLRSPPSLGSFKVILGNMVLIELSSCICSFLVMIRLIPSGTLIGYAYLGPCTRISMFFCHFAYCTVLHACAHSLYICLLSFGYRLYVLQRPGPSRSVMAAICVTIYLPSLAAMLSLLFTLSPADKALSALALARPEYDLSHYDLTVHLDIRDPFIMFTVLFMTLPAAPCMITVVMLRQRVVNLLARSVGDMSSKTHKMHHDLIKILTLQCLLPAFFVGGVICFALCTFNIAHSPTIEHSIIGFLGVGPAISPMITIAHIRPYREFAKSLCFWNDSRKGSEVKEISTGPNAHKISTRSVVNLLARSVGDMSSKTHKMHHDLIKILTLQCLLPAFFVGGVICFALCTFNIAHSPTIEHSIIGFLGVGPAISPMITIAHIRPYREFAKSLCFWNDSRKGSEVKEISTGPNAHKISTRSVF